MLKLEAKKREIFGKKVKSLIDSGFIPAEIYGPKKENLHISVGSKEFGKVFKEAGESAVVNVEFEGKIYPVLVNDFQKDSVKNIIIHIDFYLVQMDKKITTHVPLHFEGEAPAVREKGGTLVKSLDKVEVEALPADLPQSLIVDVSSLVEIHQNLHISNIKVSKGVKILNDPETVVASIAEQMKEEVVEKPAEEIPAEGAAPAEGQVEGEVKADAKVAEKSK